MDSLTQEARERLLSDAVTHLVTPRKQDYGVRGNGKSPLQEQFEQALFTASHKIAVEVIESDPRFKAAVRDSVISFIDGLHENSWDTQLTEAAVRAIVDQLRQGKEYK